MVTNEESGLWVAGARSTWEGSRTIAWLWGDHDTATAGRLTEFLVDAAEGGDDLVVDLSAVLFMDASTISAIVRARSRMAETSRVLTVRSPSALMEQVFGVCGLTDLIEAGESPRVERPVSARSALESWVAVAPRNPAPSDRTQLVSEEAHQASHE